MLVKESTYILHRSSTGPPSASHASRLQNSSAVRDSIAEITDRIAMDILGGRGDGSGGSVKTRRAAVKLSQPASRCSIL